MMKFFVEDKFIGKGFDVDMQSKIN